MTVDELDEHRLQSRYQGDGVTAIADAPLREPIAWPARSRRPGSCPERGRPASRSRSATAPAGPSWCSPGARNLPGLKLGGGLAVEGVGRLERNRLTLLNPAYTLC